MRKVSIVLIIIFMSSLIFASNTIAVSVIPQETFVNKVGGDYVEVITMIPPGYSPANYAPTPKQLMDFSEAKIYFTIGVPSENSYILPRVDSFNKDIKIVSLQNEVEEIYPARYFSQESRDPHIWLSPKRVILMIDIIKRELSALEPEHSEYYEKNAEKYIDELEELDIWIKNITDKITNRTFIVYHPSFGYFADDYNLEMLSLEKDGKEATPKTLQEMVDTAKEEGIKVIFYQAEIDSKQTISFAEEIGGKSLMVNPLSEDYIQNLKRMAETFSKELK